MRAKKVLSIVLVMVLLAFAVPLAVTPAAAEIYYEIPGDISPHDDKLTKDELTGMILPYMLDEGTFALDDVGDAAYVYAYWDGDPRTVMEKDDREVTFYRPVERVVIIGTMTSVMLGGCDRLVGVMASMFPEEEKACGGKLLNFPYTHYTDPELTASLKPELVIGYYRGDPEIFQEKVNALAVRDGPTVSVPYGEYYSEQIYSSIAHIGTVTDMEEEAEELISFIKEKQGKVFDVVSEIPDSEKPKACRVIGKGKVSLARSSHCMAIDEAGGISIKKDLGVKEISVEKLIEWNPDVIFVLRSGSYSLRGKPSSSPVTLTVEQVLADPQLQTVNAVKNGSVYYITGGCYITKRDHRIIVTTLHMAKIFYPDKFKDLDLEKEGNEIFERFYGADGLYTEMADNLGYLREYIEESKG
jgi:ABC-type Fe3+-hydroxamate transport system substrate-binding protein